MPKITRWFHRKQPKPLIFKALRHQKRLSKNHQKWLDKSSPKGENCRAVGGLLKANGYKVRVLDLINMEKSHCYNPFVYLKDDNDIQRLVTNLFKSTTPKGSTSSDPFWDIAAYKDSKEYENWLGFIEQGGTTQEWNVLMAMPSNIYMNAQNKHIQGTNEYKTYQEKFLKDGEYGSSYVSLSTEEMRKLVDKYRGSGII